MRGIYAYHASIYPGVTCRRPLTRPFFCGRKDDGFVQPEKGEKEVISATQNSLTAGYLQGVSLHEGTMLASVLKRVKKEGAEEVKWGDVAQILRPHARRLESDGFSFFTHGQVQCRHAVYTSVPTGDDGPMRKPTFAELVHPNPASWDPGPTFSFCHPGSSPTPVLSRQCQPPGRSDFRLRRFLRVVLLWHLSYSLVPSGCSSVADGENRMVTAVCTTPKGPLENEPAGCLDTSSREHDGVIVTNVN